MSEQPPEPELFDDQPRPGSRRASRRPGRVRGCVSVLVVLVVVVALGWLGVTKGIDAVKGAFGDPPDYAGPGSGRVVFQVRDGDTTSEIGRDLERAGVVQSVEAFTDAVSSKSASIQPGVFVLKEEMRAADVVRILDDEGNDTSLSLTFLAGKTTGEIVDLLAQNTGFGKAEYQKVLDHPDALGLPSYAGGDAEGYLFPDKYVFGPDDTPTTILKAMVDRWRQAADDARLEDAADELGYTPQQLLTISSLIQAEGSTLSADDKARIARVIYNRLEVPGNPSAGFLQLDATVNYALGENPDDQTVRLSEAQIDSVADSPYNTYTQKGLPPGPIEAPGQSALEAAAHPADGPWFFYLTVNLKTAETKFTDSNQEFLQFKAELDQYCATQSQSC